MTSIDASGNVHRPAGTPIGGQFAGRANTAPGESLRDESVNDNVTALIRRRAELVRAGYAPAVAGPSLGTAPRSTEGIDTWWDEHFRRAEVRHGATYPQMPDDYNPKGTGGRALSGKRRTHRILYEGAGIALRMPSATAIKRFSREQGDRTFDVPVQAEGQNGQVVAGYVRVTQEAPGKWTVDALGMPSHVAWKVSESVTSVLEARRPSLALREVGDLLQRRRERLARVGAQLTTAENSSWVSALGYNSAAGEMVITLGQRTYGYKVPEQVFHRVRNAYSAGAAYNQLVKGAPRISIEQCGTCSRWYNTAAGHSCMRHRPADDVIKPFNERVRAYVLASANRGM